MIVCPTCGVELQQADSGSGWVWTCATCHGRALTLALLRKGIEQKFINDLWQKARQLAEEGKRGQKGCPSCKLRMVTVNVGDDEKPLVLDVCAPCQFVWFDDRETESLPIQPPVAGPVREAELPPEAREAIAMARVGLIAERARLEEKIERAGRSPFSWENLLFSLFR